MAGAIVAHRHNRHELNEWLSYTNLGLLTLEMAYSLVTLVVALPRHVELAPRLLQSAGVLWLGNVIVFAAWYWRLDAGGPHARDQHDAHLRGAFLFPRWPYWRPELTDYLSQRPMVGDQVLSTISHFHSILARPSLRLTSRYYQDGRS